MSTYHRRPRFSSGKLLRSEHLTALERQSFDVPALFFEGWGNGILSGCTLSTTADTITMGPGVIRFEDALYGIQEPVYAPYSPSDETRYLKLYIGSNEGSGACDVRRFSLKLSEQERLGSGELELCRFRLQPGAYLRGSYTGFRDRETLYDTLNTIHSTYSAPGGTGLNPAITRAYAEEALRLGAIPDLDTAVCIGWLNQTFAVCRKSAAYYLARFGCVSETLPGNQELFQGLLARLEQLKEGSGPPALGRKTGRKMILID